jgi:predicted DCC family thiol-disulfide oxidoreductase YuxK
VLLGSSWPVVVNLLGLVPVAFLAIGARDRIASLVLAVWVTLLTSWSMAAVLLLHAALPSAPYGSWEARRRDDPGGHWEMPEWAPLVAWGLIGIVHAYWGVNRLMDGFPTLVVGLVELGLLGAAAMPDYRRWAWLALTLLSVANNDPVGVLLIHAFAFDPSWIPSSSRLTPATVFYDGTCGLCHRTVRFLLAEDRTGLFQLASMQSPAFTRLVPLEERAELPDSMVLRGRNGQLLCRARAAIEVGTALGGLWRAIATLWMIVPPEAADRLYDFVAARRHQLFAPPDAACPLVPPRLRTRFVPDALADDQPSEASAPR